MGTKMTIARNIRLFPCILLLTFFPLRLFAQWDGNEQVAIMPLWGDDAEAIAYFGEEIYEAMLTIEGFSPKLVDMSDLPLGIPVGGFPPSVSPSPELTGAAPLALTGLIFLNAQGQRHLRLYLWLMADNRPLFIDQMIASNQEVVSATLPFMLRWLLSWVPVPVEEPPPPLHLQVHLQPPQSIITEGQTVIIHQEVMEEVPNRWLYFGLRAGGNVQIFNPRPYFLLDDGWNADNLDFYLRNVSLAAHLHLQFLDFWLDPRYLFLGLQIEGIATHDFNNQAFSLMLPVQLGLTARRGTSSFSLLGGAYLFMSMDPLRQLLPDDLGEDYSLRIERFEGMEIGPFDGLGYTVGFRMGTRVGPGNFFMEMRWFNDLFTTVMDVGNFGRGVVSVSIGYEFGFIRRR